jgi:membrane protein
MNEKGDDRRLALEQGVGAAAPDAEVARALRADHAAGFEPLDSSAWPDIGLCVLRSVLEHRLLATSGGVAFFGLMAIFPALATIVSLYGLFADPHAIPERLAILAGVVPASVIGLLKQHILSLAENHISTLNIAFLIGFLVSMWSANSGVSALFDALNVVHGSKETRGLLQFYTRTLAITLGSVVYGVLVLIGVLPHVFIRGWTHPRKDSVMSFALNGAKFVPSLMAMDPISFATSFYPATLLVLNAAVSIMLVMRRRAVAQSVRSP